MKKSQEVLGIINEAWSDSARASALAARQASRMGAKASGAAGNAAVISGGKKPPLPPEAFKNYITKDKAQTVVAGLASEDRVTWEKLNTQIGSSEARIGRMKERMAKSTNPLHRKVMGFFVKKLSDKMVLAVNRRKNIEEGKTDNDIVQSLAAKAPRGADAAIWKSVVEAGSHTTFSGAYKHYQNRMLKGGREAGA